MNKKTTLGKVPIGVTFEYTYPSYDYSIHPITKKEIEIEKEIMTIGVVIDRTEDIIIVNNVMAFNFDMLDKELPYDLFEDLDVEILEGHEENIIEEEQNHFNNYIQEYVDELINSLNDDDYLDKHIKLMNSLGNKMDKEKFTYELLAKIQKGLKVVPSI